MNILMPVRTIRLSFFCLLALLISASALWSQQSITATYTAGDIPTSLGAYDAACNGPNATLSITLPSDLAVYFVVGVDITYEMNAVSPGVIGDQRSQIFCQNTSSAEPVVAEGIGNAAGTNLYNRTNVDIANQPYLPETVITFEMRAWRTQQGTDCNTTFNAVTDGTWKITLYYRTCPLGDVVLETQADVNAYVAEFGDCQNFVTRLEIGTLGGSSDIVDISGLNALETVNELWILGNPSLTDLTGLENLTSVEELIIGFTGVQDLNALSGLQRCPTGLNVSANPDLTSIAGLSSVTSVGYLSISANTNLTSLNGLANIDSINSNLRLFVASLSGDVPFFSNGAYLGGSIELESTPFNGFTGWTQDTVFGDFIFNTPAVKSLSGLNTLKVIKGNFRSINSRVQDLDGLNNLVSVRDTIELIFLDSLATLGLNSLQTAGSFIMRNCPQLQTFGPLPALQTITNALNLQNMDVLETINPGSLQSVGAFTVDNCPLLQSIGPLPALQRIRESIVLSDNTMLSDVSALNNSTQNYPGEIRLEQLPNLDSVQFLTGTQSIQGALTVSNTGVKSLTGMDSIVQVIGALTLDNLDSLRSLQGLQGLRSLGENLVITNNPILTNISQLASITSLPEGDISNNSELSICCILKNIVPSVTSNVTLGGNAEGCNSILEVTNICFLIDPDQDGIENANDNCPDDFNPQQQDADQDSLGNPCDNCPLIPNTNQLDSDGNFIGDACDNPEPGKTGINTTDPSSGLEIKSSDLFINDNQRSLIMKNALGECYRLFIDLEGNLVTKQIDCPD